MKKIIIYSFLIILLILLTDCGQMGKLYLPTETPEKSSHDTA